MKQKELLLENITILEWYDGVVRAIGEFHQHEYLTILAAWDMHLSRKIYVLSELDADIANEMKNVLQDGEINDKENAWEMFNAEFDKYILNYTGTAYLTGEEPSGQKLLKAIEINAAHLQKLIGYEFEDTLSDSSNDFWFKISKS